MKNYYGVYGDTDYTIGAKRERLDDFIRNEQKVTAWWY